MLKRIILKKLLTIVIFPISLFSLITFWFIYKLYKYALTFKVKVIFITSFVFMFLITMQPISGIFIHSLEKNYAPLIDSFKIKEADYIIVLGGGYNDEDNMPETSLLGSSSLQRLIEGIRLKKINPNATLIFSGAKPYTEKYSEAKIASLAYKSIVSDSSNFILSELPHNTKSEADEAHKIVGDKKLILVTTASHMPRAMYLFKKMGCNVIAAPCDFNVKNLKYYPNFPNGNSIKQTEIAIHEYMAIVGYKLFD